MKITVIGAAVFIATVLIVLFVIDRLTQSRNASEQSDITHFPST